ncbi:hypothetical protein ACUN24_07735 [Pedobacter sp. WC2501]|uniref:hypothetical protein n=1 Tax=Pedobacter sp. WC2501 TaxID=3461400 RepID=UPI004045599A
MNHKIYIAGIFLILFATACRKEEVTVFPDYDKNWLVVDDNPNDPTIHGNYLFFKDTGIPVFINDTIGTQARTDVFGRNFTHYEKLSLSYSIGGLQAGAPPLIYSFSYCNKADVPAALAYLKSEILPVLPKGIYVPSILLVDNLNTNGFKYAFKGLNTIVIGQIAGIPSMDQATKVQYKGAILRAMLTNAMLRPKYADILDKFASATRKFVIVSDAYDLATFYLNSRVTGLPAGVSPSLQAIGFIDAEPTNPYITPATPSMDANIYLQTILGRTDAEFKALYGSNPVIMIKYNLIRQILTDLGIPTQ